MKPVMIKHLFHVQAYASMCVKCLLQESCAMNTVTVT